MSAHAADCIRFPPDGERRFEIMRNGSPVGSQTIRFSRQDGRFLVQSEIDIEVSRGGATLYRYRHNAEEIWLSGRLEAFVGDTDDDGMRSLVRAERIGGIFSGRVNGQAFTVSGFIVPASFWHRDTPAAQTLWDGVDGMVKVVTGQDQGAEAIEIQGKTVETRRFEIAGQIRRDLWYDERCELVRMTFPARDGSLFLVELR